MTMHEDADAIEQQLEAELNKFAAEEAERLGLGREQWVEPVNTTFTRSQRDTTTCLLYTSPSPRDQRGSRMPSSA